MPFGADAAAAEPQVLDRDFRQERARHLEKGFERQTTVLVVVLPILITNRRPNPHAAVDGLREMRAQPMAGRMRDGIDEAVHEMARPRRQLRVLASAGIDREGFPAQEPLDIVGIQARGVHDGLRVDALAGRDDCNPAGKGFNADQWRTNEHRDIEAFGF